jgi:hypothetical protein
MQLPPSICAFIAEVLLDTLDVEENFLVMYDKAKGAIQEIVDLPDRQIDLFISLCIQSNGKLSARKRESHFEMDVLKTAE